MALLGPALAQTWTRHKLGFRPSPQDTDWAFGQAPTTQTFEGLAEGQVLKSLCLWGLAEGQVCVLRTWPKAKPVSGPSLCKCRVQQCHFCAPPPQGNSSRLGVPATDPKKSILCPSAPWHLFGGAF